jgi:hypothetical protein
MLPGLLGEGGALGGMCIPERGHVEEKGGEQRKTLPSAAYPLCGGFYFPRNGVRYAL